MGIKVICTGPSPLGPAGARNAGAEAATGQLLFFVDADVEIHGDCVGLIREFFRENPDVAAVIGSYDDAPFETNFFSQFKNLFHHYTHQRARIEAATFWGACGAMRRDVFLGEGGFDPRFARPSIEDIELGYRLIKSGHRIRLLKDLQVKHLKQWRFWMLLKSDIFDRALPWTRLILQQGKIPSDLNLKIADRISCAVVFGLILTLPFVFINNWVWMVTGFFFTVILILNRNLYLYLLGLRGGVFALKSILFHQFYLFYSGLSFMFGKMTWHLKKCSPIDHAPVIDTRRQNP
jgi:glycosyltransferase involved in cell wall biosynthesis